MPNDRQDVTQQQIARSAAIVSIGNVLSRVMGLVRGTVISDLFGTEKDILAYTAASLVPRRLYELLIGGMITSALVPTFSEYVAKEKREELWHVASLLFTLVALALGVAVLILEIGAPLVTRVLVSGFGPPLREETTRLLRIVLLGVVFLGFSGLSTALCQALQRFALPAFTTVVFNTSIVVAALVLGPRWGVRGLAVGLAVGAMLQFVLQVPALYDMRFRPALELRHPALRHILRLYLPVILGMIPNELGIALDRNLASRVGNSMAIMEYATQLIQFPLGLVSIAVATAILPALARQAVKEQERANSGSAPGNQQRTEFRATLAGGLRLVLVLTLPAVAGLFVLAEPVVALIFQHGEFNANDTIQTALALRYYLIGLLFAAVDQPLVFAFYARKDTLTPALVGVLGVVFYAMVALPTWRTLGMVGLILGNGAQLAGHALAMIWLFQRKVGTLRGYGIGQALLKSTLAAAAMGIAVYVAVWGVQNIWPTEGRPSWAIAVAVGGSVGLGTYLASCTRLRVRELELLRQIVQKIIPSRISSR